MTAKKVVEMANEEVIDEKKILKEAEEREKERKAEEEVAKEEEKKAEKEEKKEEKKKVEQKKRKPLHGKKYRELAKQIEKDTEYPIAEAIELALKTSPVKFDATIEAHFKINPKEKNIRGMITLAGGLVKEKKVKEVTEGNVDEVIAEVKAGKVDFDVMIAELKAMPKLAQLAKVLGPKGLMPSPKAGTAVEDVAKAVEELKSGKVEYRADKFNIVHLALGKISFGSERVKQNYDAILNALPFKKIETIFLTSTMGPSVKVARK
ncbi:MAG: 50S ribosomal protein L1 [Patescibacteria group bacterium]